MSLIDVEVLDHVIVSPSGTFSFEEEGVMAKLGVQVGMVKTLLGKIG